MELICLDMDGVLTTESNFWLRLHESYGTLTEGKELTRQYLHTDYDRLVKEVVGRLWKGKSQAEFDRLVARIPLQVGAQDLFVHLEEQRVAGKCRVAIITSGPMELASRITGAYPVDCVFANQLHFTGGKVDGRFSWPVGAGTQAKVEIVEGICRDLGLQMKDVTYVGDSTSDLALFQVVGKSIAFNTNCGELRNRATHVVDGTLRDVIPYLS
jgi:HAD superfamily phosphoserine phosphatase-like hydrolase